MVVHVLFSGGMDSTALLFRAVRVNGAANVRAISFDYGQRHVRELRAAEQIAADLGVDHIVLNLRGLLTGSALLGEGDIPHGHYADESMAATVVPGRNLLFAAAVIAQARAGDVVMLGVHAGDHPVYPDCRPEFVRALAEAAQAYDVTISAPWVNITKADIVMAEPRAPYEFSWSCYEGGAYHCGQCGTCVERREAFELAGAPDRTTYALMSA
jgi:7-cyano-7-deazaguanine synthase